MSGIFRARYSLNLPTMPAIVFYILCVFFAWSTFVLFQWILHYARIKKMLKGIPGPTIYPLIGNAMELIGIAPEDRLKWIADMCYTFKNGMVLFWMGPEPILIIRKPRQLERILKSNTLIKKSSGYDALKPWLGEGLVTSTGKTWQHHRRMITPAFHFSVLEEYFSVMKKNVKTLNEVIMTEYLKNPTVPIDSFEIINRYTLDTICETAMGVRVNTQEQPSNEYCKELHNVLQLSSERNIRFWLKSNFVYFRTSNGKKYLKALKTMHEFTEQVILEKQKKRAERKLLNDEKPGEDVFGKRKPKAFLDLLMDASENTDNPLSLKELREEVDTFMFAGQDTTAIAICNALFALGNAPEVQAKVHEELKEVFGDSTEGATTEQLGQLKYLGRVIKETLRLYPSAPSVSRSLEHDIDIDGHLIPKGTMVAMHIYLLHRDPDNFSNPEVFDPDRHLPENLKDRHPYSYIPFSAGPRNCIGQKFAFLELKTVLTAVLRKWKVSSVLKPSEMKFVMNVTLRPANEKIELYFTPMNEHLF